MSRILMTTCTFIKYFSLASIVTLLTLGTTYAQNRVVVIPLEGNRVFDGYEIVTNDSFASVSAGLSMIGFANCPSGKKAIGGGAESSNQVFQLADSYPDNNGRVWQVTVRNTGATAASNIVTTSAICAIISN